MLKNHIKSIYVITIIVFSLSNLALSPNTIFNIYQNKDQLIIDTNKPQELDFSITELSNLNGINFFKQFSSSNLQRKYIDICKNKVEILKDILIQSNENLEIINNINSILLGYSIEFVSDYPYLIKIIPDQKKIIINSEMINKNNFYIMVYNYISEVCKNFKKELSNKDIDNIYIKSTGDIEQKNIIDNINRLFTEKKIIIKNA